MKLLHLGAVWLPGRPLRLCGLSSAVQPVRQSGPGRGFQATQATVGRGTIRTNRPLRSPGGESRWKGAGDVPGLLVPGRSAENDQQLVHVQAATGRVALDVPAVAHGIPRSCPGAPADLHARVGVVQGTEDRAGVDVPILETRGVMFSAT